MEKDIREIIGYAIYAPSGDNSQPWIFKVNSNKLELFIDPNKDNPILNYKLSGTYISAGAVVENISIACERFGLIANINLFPNKNDLNYVAHIVFEKKPISNINKLFDSIKLRCTNRKSYQKVKLNEQIRAIISNNYYNSDCRLIIVDDPRKVKRISDLCSLTEEIALETPAIHKLFFENITWSREAEKKKGMGLYILTLELAAPIRLLFKLLKNWNFTRSLNMIGLSKIAAKGNAYTYSQSSMYIAIVSKNTLPENFVSAGRLMQKVWLTATSLKLSVQPVTGIFFFIMRLLGGDTSDFMPKHIPIIKKAYNKLYCEYGIDSGLIVMNLRIGVAKEPTARSLRIEPNIIEI